MLCNTYMVYAQTTGKIEGIITDAETGETVPFATVQIKGTTTAVTSDLDGKYSIEVKPGTYTLEVQFFGFDNYEIKDITVQAGETIEKNANLGAAPEMLEVVEIVGISSKESTAAVLQKQKESTNVSDAVTAETFEKTDDSNAAGAVKRVSGVSIQGGKYVYVRGLGDRYTKTLVNGLTVPGLDPDRNTIQIDIFPTSMIGNITVIKSATADLPADFSGGLVDIQTKSYPNEKTINVSASLGYNPHMNLKKDFLYDPKGGGLDFLGFDDGTRATPLGETESFQTIDINNAESVSQASEIANKMTDNIAVSSRRSFLNYSLGASIGNKIKKKETTFGYYAALSYKTKYTLYDDYERGDYMKVKDEQVNDLLLQRYSKGNVSTDTRLLNAYVSAGMKKKKSNYNISAFHIQNGESTASLLSTVSPEGGLNSNDFTSIDNLLVYTQKSISSLSLSGNHDVSKKDIEIDWKISPTYASIKDKDLRSTPLMVMGDGTYTLNRTSPQVDPRLWRGLDEFVISGRADIKKSFEIQKDQKSFVSSGLSFVNKSRDFSLTNYTLTFNDVIETDDDDPNFIFDDLISTTNNDGLYYVTSYQPANFYEATQTTLSAYAKTELVYSEKYKAVLGLRLENYKQTYTGQNTTGSSIFNDVSVIDVIDLFPSTSFIYSPVDNSNLRFSYARTTARPSFKELSTSSIYDPVSGNRFNGNLDSLKQSYIHNIDVRWETYLEKTQFFAFSAFYKRMIDPIEIVLSSEQRSNEFTAQNNGNANILGVEAELRKNLAFLNPSLENLFLNINGSFIYSRIEMGDVEYNSRLESARDGESVDRKRELQGQAPYLVNATLSYETDSTGLSLALSYNVQGKKLAFVGAGEFPDVYETPFNSLNFVASKKFGKDEKNKFSFSINNILNDDVLYQFESYGVQDEVYLRRRPRRELSVSYSRTF